MENLRELFSAQHTLHGLPAGHNFYLVNGTKISIANGDTNERNYNFLVAALSETYAQYWASFTFLANSSSAIQTDVELKEYLVENLYDSEEGLFDADYNDWVDMGDDTLKILNSCQQISREEAETLLKYQAFDYGNIYI